MNGISDNVRAEAVRWFALLHGPHRTTQADMLFRQWCQASEQNEAAYDLVTQMWDRTQYLRKDGLPLLRKPVSSRSQVRGGLMALAAVVTLLMAVSLLYTRNPSIQTGVGEQRTIILEDGTRVSLNTSTELRVQYDEHQRTLLLENGEALFEVAQDRQRPFIVQTGTHQVKALGTVFVVRASDDAFAVTLVEGEVAVSEQHAISSTAQKMAPGERLTYTKSTAPQRDHPSVQKLTAWRVGRVEMDRMPLYVAAAEMNRYSTVKLRVEQPEAQVIPVTGSFRTGDLMSFADTLVRTCRLQLSRGADELVLSGVPSDNCR